MNSKRPKKNRTERACDPALCDNCIYMGEGDFICDRFADKGGSPAMVMCDWDPTEHYMRCKNK